MTIVAIALAVSLVAGLLVWRLAVEPLRQLRTQMAAERARFETLAHEDPLTSLPNKRAFNDRLDAELRRAQREYYPVAAVVLDLDHFKEINDAWGHAVGDEALVTFSDFIRAQLRAGDLAGRLGGDEFALVLVRADAKTAEHVLSRMRSALEPVSVGPAQDRLQFSAGIAEFPRHATSREQLLQRADQALYWGKANGRARSAVFSSESDEQLSPEGREEALRRRSLVGTLQALAKAVDEKNRWTTGHSDRVAVYAVALANKLGLPDARIDSLRQAALLHDVGKIGIQETILTKEEALNLEEVDELQRHSELGRAMLAGAGLPELARFVHLVHERYDGQGYPFGLAGREIPVESRILHAADALDEMTRPNAYRRMRPLREALAELSYCAGTRVDPEMAGHLIGLVEAGELKIPDAQAAASRRRSSRATSS